MTMNYYDLSIVAHGKKNYKQNKLTTNHKFLAAIFGQLTTKLTNQNLF